MRKTSPLALLPLLLALGGCASWTSTPYEAPVLDLPARWTPPALPAGVETTANWWQAFNDPALNTLVDEVLARNNDLAVAGLRLQQARLQAGLAFSNQLPSVSVRQTGNASRQLGQGDSVTHAYGLTGGLSYEVDLWGKLSRQHDASQWEAEATAADLAGTRLTLIGSTATLYWQLGYLNQRLTLAQANTAYTAETLKLVEAQYRAGAASRLEVLSASQSLESQKASETDLMQQREEARSALAILLDGPPGRVLPEPSLLPEASPPEVPAGLPAGLLARRPDLMAAELRLRSSLASVDVTRASFYPVLSLTGSLGTSSAALGQLLQNPLGMLASELTLPFLNWNEWRLSVQISENDYQQAQTRFRQTVYGALKEVHDSLSARQQLAEKDARLTASLAAAREVERLYGVRYRVGATSLKDWLDAQQTRRTAETGWLDNRFEQYRRQIILYQALGGGA